MRPIEEIDVGNFTIKIYQDDTPQSPREWNNVGVMCCFHRNYNLGDEHSFSDPEELETYLKQKKGSVVLSLYLYDHSGISMSCSNESYPYNCLFDSGQVGYIFMTPDMIRKEYNRKKITKDIRAKVTKCLQQEVETYNQYLIGEVYGYQIEDNEGEHIDSCWGFYGMESCIDQAKESAQYYVELDTNKSAAMLAFFSEDN